MVQSLARGLEILQILQRKRYATATEIAKELMVNKSTAFRLIETLMYYDMVSIDPISKKYRLGFRNLNLGESVREIFDIAIISRPYIQRICDEIKESVHLGTLGNGKVYIVDQVLSKAKYSLSAEIGMIEEWHCSAVGKSILAFKSEQYIDNVLRNYPFEKHTSNTIQNAEDLKKELSKIREQGYALDDEEVALGVRCIAVPVRYYSNVFSSVGISAPKEQLTDRIIQPYVMCMKRECIKITNQLERANSR
jgi:IclR family KDG regulon transcriptional repressor